VKRGGIGGSVAKKQRGGGDSYDAVETQGQGYLHGVAVCGSGCSSSGYVEGRTVRSTMVTPG
jgi:hypothetical protein